MHNFFLLQTLQNIYIKASNNIFKKINIQSVVCIFFFFLIIYKGLFLWKFIKKSLNISNPFITWMVFAIKFVNLLHTTLFYIYVNETGCMQQYNIPTRFDVLKVVISWHEYLFRILAIGQIIFFGYFLHGISCPFFISWIQILIELRLYN